MDGRLLSPYLPYGLVIEPTPAGGTAILEPADRSLAGQLTLPYLAGRLLEFADLQVPSSGRFTQEDLRELWAAGSELAEWRSARIALARRGGDFGQPQIAGNSTVINDWKSLRKCGRDAANLLRHWPTRLERRPSWLPIGVPGGTEDLPITERQAAKRGFLLANGGNLGVTQSARWLGDRRPLPSSVISALARAVVNLVRSSMPPAQLNLLRPLLEPLVLVSRQATAPANYSDPELSSWPPPFAAFAGSCVAAIAEIQSSQRGEGVVPLLDTDEMYEAWVAVQVRAVLDERFGGWRVPGSDALAAWEEDDTTYELWLKPGITRAGRRFGAGSFRAVVAEILTPDLVLSASRGDETELAVLDAKAWTAIMPDGVLVQSTKYLWGIRRVPAPGAVPALARVDLITCAPPPDVSDSDIARVAVTTATPTRGGEALRSRVDSIVTTLAESLAERERLASAY